MPLITATKLRALGVQLLSAKEVPLPEAETVSASLVDANLKDHEGHGVVRLARYLAQIAEGLIIPGVTPKVMRSVGGLARYNCEFGFGQSAMQFVTDRMITEVKERHLGLSFLTQCNHVGCLSYFSDQFALAGLCAMIFANVNGKPRVSSHGGIDPRLGTNPLAMSAPWGNGAFSYDSSTSAVVEGMTNVRHLNHEPMEPGMLRDAEGDETCDPGVVYATPSGSIRPLGNNFNDFKGSGLAMAIDVFAGIFSGSGFPQPDAVLGRNGVMIVAFQPWFLITAEETDATLDRYSAWIKSSRPAAGVDEVLLPGEPEAHAKADRLEHGIPISDGTWDELRKTYGSLGLPGSIEDYLV